MVGKKSNGSTAHMANGHTKIDHYSWKVVDKPGVFMLLPKTRLLIDASYQRDTPANQERILKMAANWSWIACTALTVASRNGLYYVMDGQGRKLAADKRADIDQLPCMVYQTTNAAEEAQGFLNINVDRRPMLAVQKFRALLKVGDPEALFVDRLVKRSGLHIGGHASPGAVRCVAVLLNAAALDRAALGRIWPVVAHLCRNDAMSSDLAAGAFTLERRALYGVSLAALPWKDRFLRVGYDGMMASIGRAKAYYAGSGGGTKAYAEGIAAAMNKGMRTKLVVFTPGETGEVELSRPVRDVPMSAMVQ